MARDARGRRNTPRGCSVACRAMRAGVAWGSFVLLLFAVATGCASRAPQTAAERAARAQQLIDSGNAAYRQGDYRLAVRRYSAAAVERNDDPAAYYGMGMALGKLGRDEEARAAYQRARDLTQAAVAPSGSAPNAPPAGHP
jgi:tetratricopeptide (TPR) repeat protein